MCFQFLIMENRYWACSLHGGLLTSGHYFLFRMPSDSGRFHCDVTVNTSDILSIFLYD
uniref:Uncharacterized protein n=1 Tax=Anguilla anguilla TaxID=7936 RepID=A0A0E9R7R0_ANGAN